MQLVEHTFHEMSALEYHIHTTSLPSYPQSNVLIVAFEGTYGIGSKGNGDANFINAIIAGARAAWEASSFVLDYRSMDYEWGDGLTVATGQEKLTAEEYRMLGPFFPSPICSATLISDRNREAIHSLVRSEYGHNPDAVAGSEDAWLFDDLASALTAFEDARHQFRAGAGDDK